MTFVLFPLSFTLTKKRYNKTPKSSKVSKTTLFTAWLSFAWLWLRVVFIWVLRVWESFKGFLGFLQTFRV